MNAADPGRVRRRPGPDDARLHDRRLASFRGVRVLGVDVSARAFHLVGLDDRGRIVYCDRLPTGDDRWLEEVPPGLRVGIDGPDGPSAAPFAADETLPPKFRTARGAEVELGRAHRLWVSWPTPTSIAAMPAWMIESTRLFQTLRASGHEPFETWPYATFRLLTNRSSRELPSKATADGRRVRAEALAGAGLSGPELRHATHDTLDAASAALVALQRARGDARRVHCELDGSTIYLPAAVTEAPGSASRVR